MSLTEGIVINKYAKVNYSHIALLTPELGYITGISFNISLQPGDLTNIFKLSNTKYDRIELNLIGSYARNNDLSIINSLSIAASLQIGASIYPNLDSDTLLYTSLKTLLEYNTYGNIDDIDCNEKVLEYFRIQPEHKIFNDPTYKPIDMYIEWEKRLIHSATSVEVTNMHDSYNLIKEMLDGNIPDSRTALQRYSFMS